jgi:hypothetical protein
MTAYVKDQSLFSSEAADVIISRFEHLLNSAFLALSKLKF